MMMGAMMAMSAEAMQHDSGFGNPDPDDFKPYPKEPIKKVVPKGCKEYWFWRSGRFINDPTRESDSADYYCVAASDKSAKRKFENWKSRHKFD